MARKHVLTPAEIEADLIHACKQPQAVSEADHKRWTIPAIILAAVMLVSMFVYPLLLVWILLGAIAFAIGDYLILRVRIQRKAKKISISDYEIQTQTVSHTHTESFVVKARHSGQRITNYSLHFENGSSWRIPNNNYAWSEERRMSDFAIYESTHRGDAMIVVTKKNTGEVAMAYPTAYFEYKN